MNIHLIGGSSVSGKFFILQNKFHKKDRSIINYSRKSSIYKIDLFKPSKFYFAMGHEKGLLISFAPIWLIAPFIDNLSTNHRNRLVGIKGIIACSSTSVVTKSSAKNLYDKELVKKLKYSEMLLEKTCKSLNISCIIIRPTMIYGSIDNKKDENISKLIKMMNILPILPIPSKTGLRQPIHASQLAELIHNLIYKLRNEENDKRLVSMLSIGGDNEITYRQMIEIIKRKAAPDSKAKNCIILAIPNKIFYILIFPIKLLSPKWHEAIHRISNNLAGFIKVSSLSGHTPRDFPIS